MSTLPHLSRDGVSGQKEPPQREGRCRRPAARARGVQVRDEMLTHLAACLCAPVVHIAWCWHRRFMEERPAHSQEAGLSRPRSTGPARSRVAVRIWRPVSVCLAGIGACVKAWRGVQHRSRQRAAKAAYSGLCREHG